MINKRVLQSGIRLSSISFGVFSSGTLFHNQVRFLSVPGFFSMEVTNTPGTQRSLVRI